MDHVSVLALAGCVALQAAMGTLRLSDAAQLSLRQGDFEDGAALDVENTPRLETGLAWPGERLQLTYRPRLLWLDVLGDTPSPALLLHDAELALSLQRPRYELTLSQTGMLGERSFTRATAPGLSPSGAADADAEASDPDGAGDGLDLDLRPAARSLRVASAQTSAALRYALSRRWGSELSAALGISGGADRADRARLPRLRTAELVAALEYRRSRRDQLVTRASGTQIHSSSGYDHSILSLSEQWAIDWSAQTSSGLEVGAALYETTEPDGQQATDLSALGSASLGHTIASRDVETRLSLGVDYGVAPNVLLGSLQGRLSATGRASASTTRSRLTLALGAARIFAGEATESARLYTATAVLDHELLEWLGLQLGGELSHQELIGTSLPEPTFSVWLLYAGLEARLLERRFRCC